MKFPPSSSWIIPRDTRDFYEPPGTLIPMLGPAGETWILLASASKTSDQPAVIVPPTWFRDHFDWRIGAAIGHDDEAAEYVAITGTLLR
jgi:hypothetical protein